MPRSERDRREDLVPTTGRVAPSPEVVAPMPAAVLRMQATIGNRATGEVLARAPEKTAVKQGVSVAGFGEYKLYSFHRDSATRVAVTLDPGDDAAKLFSAASQGQPIKTVTIGHAGHVVTLREVVIASVRHGGEEAPTLLEVEFDAGSIDFDS
jgi:hypothetical protein